MSGKYAPLTFALNSLPSTRYDATMTFDEIQSIIGSRLPPSASRFRPWWANQTNQNHSQARAWMDAGFQVDSIDLAHGWVRFVRKETRVRTRESVEERPDRMVTIRRELAGSGGGEIGLANRGKEAVRSGKPDQKRIALISCSAKKLPYRALAKDLYASPLFQMQLGYARQIAADAIFILSAKHGLIGLDEEIEPYEKTLKSMGKNERRAWAAGVVDDLAKVADLSEDHFIFLAGEAYRKDVAPSLCHWEAPLAGLTIGRQLQRLRELADE
ncbi:MAG TPA: hypothetical protein PKC23_08765 [Candidatus Desulfobacillus sp.]|nr:hypothetical protein [Candidatus Desulfobacillus sp.]